MQPRKAMITKVHNYLLALKAGESIILESRKNQHGETIPTAWLQFDKGMWVFGEIQCLSSSWYGLGTCQCNSHEPADEDVVSRQYALQLLRDKAFTECKTEEERQIETDWLESITTVK